jgi:hypothetical protein
MPYASSDGSFIPDGNDANNRQRDDSVGNIQVAKEGQESVGQGEATVGKKDFGDEVADNVDKYISQKHAVDQGKISKFAVCADVGLSWATIDQSYGFGASAAGTKASVKFTRWFGNAVVYGSYKVEDPAPLSSFHL